MLSLFLVLVSIPGVYSFLRSQPIEPFVPCADGSPAGIYVEQEPFIPIIQNRNHVLVFIGGGACSNTTDCYEGYEIEPFKFTSKFNPDVITGHNMLSGNSNENDLHDYHKVLIPYCSQDFFLGDERKGQIGNFTHAGSTIFDSAMDHWVNLVLSAVFPHNHEENHNLLDNLVIVGSSAGAIGVANNIGKLREAAIKVGVKNLRILLDSPTVLSDRDIPEKDWRQMMSLYVNFTEHPLCNPFTDYSRLYVQGSVLPCCLSTHCLMRHDAKGLASFLMKQEEGAINETLLVLDSAYDTFSVADTFIEDEIVPLEPKDNDDETANELWYVVEFAGNRKTRALETTAEMKHMTNALPGEISPRVQWIFTSCVTHTFMANSVELLHLSCQYGDYKDKDYNIKCRYNGFAIEHEIEEVRLRIRNWRTTETWDLVMFKGYSIRWIIMNFLTGKNSLEVFNQRPSYLVEEVVDLRFDKCNGPNCLEEGVDTYNVPSCQALIEIENSFRPIPKAFEIILLILILSILFSSVIRVTSKLYCRAPKANETRARKSLLESMKRSMSVMVREKISVEGISVVATDTNEILVSRVSISLERGSINGLTGRSGCGKSTLLRALSQLKQAGLDVTIEAGATTLGRVRKRLLRQEDDIGFPNLTPLEYLHLTARIYDTPMEKYGEVLNFALNLLKQGNCKEADDALAPLIKNLSGGQKRILSIIGTLFSDPEFLLLDEPLSGLDSVSCKQLLKCLKVITKFSGCIVFMVLHQPSPRILKFLDKLLVLKDGKTVYDDKAIDCPLHSLLKSSSLKSVEGRRNRDEERPTAHINMEANGPRLNASDEPNGLKSQSGILRSRKLMDNAFQQEFSIEPSIKRHFFTGWKRVFARKQGFFALSSLRQVSPLAERIHKDVGWGGHDILVLTIALAMVSAIMRLEHISQAQVVLVTLSMVAIPGILFSHVIVEYVSLWLAHKREIDDGLVSLLAFQLVTSLFTYSVPLVAIIVSGMVSYAILQWNFQVFIIQTMFSIVHFMIEIQFSRVLTVWLRGNLKKVVKVYTVCLFLSFCFSSVPIASRKFPSGLLFLFLLSIDFWAISGSVMNHFNPEHYSNAEDCNDYATCLLSNGSFIVRYMGFSPLSNEFRALGVLIIVFALLFLLEYILLRRTCGRNPAIANDTNSSLLTDEDHKSLTSRGSDDASLLSAGAMESGDIPVIVNKFKDLSTLPETEVAPQTICEANDSCHDKPSKDKDAQKRKKKRQEGLKKEKKTKKNAIERMDDPPRKTGKRCIGKESKTIVKKKKKETQTKRRNGRNVSRFNDFNINLMY